MQKCCNRYLAELIGTFVLVLFGCGSAVLAGGHIGFIGISFTFGLTLMMLIYTIGPVSGCHVNPAVTIGLSLIGKCEKSHVIPYIIAQLIGATAGAFVLYHIALGMEGFDIEKGFALNGFQELSPSHYGLISVALTEIILTGILVFAVLGTTVKSFPVGFAGVSIGVALTATNLIAIPVSNASINFARSFGPAVIAMNPVALNQLAYFFVFSIVGAILGVILHKMVRCGDS